jgi:hypothetical protein
LRKYTFGVRPAPGILVNPKKAKKAQAFKVPQRLPAVILGETGDAGKLGNCEVAIFVEVEEAGKNGRD